MQLRSRRLQTDTDTDTSAEQVEADRYIYIYLYITFIKLVQHNGHSDDNTYDLRSVPSGLSAICLFTNVTIALKVISYRVVTPFLGKFTN